MLVPWVVGSHKLEQYKIGRKMKKKDLYLFMHPNSTGLFFNKHWKIERFIIAYFSYTEGLFWRCQIDEQTKVFF